MLPKKCSHQYGYLKTITSYLTDHKIIHKRCSEPFFAKTFTLQISVNGFPSKSHMQGFTDSPLFQPTHMADFSHIQSLQTVVGEGVGKAVLQLRVAGSAELLTITCPSLSVAENMADLVDGYCRLVNNSTTSIWNRKGILNFLTFFLLFTIFYTLISCF